MRTLLKNVMFGAIALSLTSAAFAQSKEDDAVAYVKKAIDLIKKEGKDKAYAELNDVKGPWSNKSDLNKNGDLYALVYNFDGVQPVHGKNPKIPGKNVLEMKDADGTPLIKEILKACNLPEGHGWVNYKWVNSITNKIDPKKTYAEKFGDVCVATGIYKTN